MSLAAVLLVLWLPLLEGTSPVDCGGKFPEAWNQTRWPAELDWGIYWFGPNDQAEKAVVGRSLKFYDPTRPTILHFPGWTGGHGGFTSHCLRLTTECLAIWCPQATRVADAWIERGWNFGIFYWDQFADEPCPRDAEMKVWADDPEVHASHLRYDTFDPVSGEEQYTEFLGPDKSVTELCVRAVKDVLSDFSGPSIRFSGHSISVQLAVRCGHELAKIDHPAAPHRLALMDPFFTDNVVFKNFCSTTDRNLSASFGTHTASRIKLHIRELWATRGVITEIYRSSPLSEWTMFGIPNTGMDVTSVEVMMSPSWCGLAGFECKHIAAWSLYFLACPQWEGRDEFPSPWSTDLAMRGFMGQSWGQTRGDSTFETCDDEYTQNSRPVESLERQHLRAQVLSEAKVPLERPAGTQSEQRFGEVGPGSWSLGWICLPVSLTGTLLCLLLCWARPHKQGATRDLETHGPLPSKAVKDQQPQLHMEKTTQDETSMRSEQSPGSDYWVASENEVSFQKEETRPLLCGCVGDDCSPDDSGMSEVRVYDLPADALVEAKTGAANVPAPGLPTEAVAPRLADRTIARLPEPNLLGPFSAHITLMEAQDRKLPAQRAMQLR